MFGKVIEEIKEDNFSSLVKNSGFWNDIINAYKSKELKKYTNALRDAIVLLIEKIKLFENQQKTIFLEVDFSNTSSTTVLQNKPQSNSDKFEEKILEKYVTNKDKILLAHDRLKIIFNFFCQLTWTLKSNDLNKKPTIISPQGYVMRQLNDLVIKAGGVYLLYYSIIEHDSDYSIKGHTHVGTLKFIIGALKENFEITFGIGFDDAFKKFNSLYNKELILKSMIPILSMMQSQRTRYLELLFYYTSIQPNVDKRNNLQNFLNTNFVIINNESKLINKIAKENSENQTIAEVKRLVNEMVIPVDTALTKMKQKELISYENLDELAKSSEKEMLLIVSVSKINSNRLVDELSSQKIEALIEDLESKKSNNLDIQNDVMTLSQAICICTRYKFSKTSFDIIKFEWQMFLSAFLRFNDIITSQKNDIYLLNTFMQMAEKELYAKQLTSSHVQSWLDKKFEQFVSMNSFPLIVLTNIIKNKMDTVDNTEVALILSALYNHIDVFLNNNVLPLIYKNTIANDLMIILKSFAGRFLRINQNTDTSLFLKFFYFIKNRLDYDDKATFITLSMLDNDQRERNSKDEVKKILNEKKEERLRLKRSQKNKVIKNTLSKSTSEIIEKNIQKPTEKKLKKKSLYETILSIEIDIKTDKFFKLTGSCIKYINKSMDDESNKKLHEKLGMLYKNISEQISVERSQIEKENPQNLYKHQLLDYYQLKLFIDYNKYEQTINLIKCDKFLQGLTTFESSISVFDDLKKFQQAINNISNQNEHIKKTILEIQNQLEHLERKYPELAEQNIALLLATLNDRREEHLLQEKDLPLPVDFNQVINAITLNISSLEEKLFILKSVQDEIKQISDDFKISRKIKSKFKYSLLSYLDHQLLKLDNFNIKIEPINFEDFFKTNNIVISSSLIKSEVTSQERPSNNQNSSISTKCGFFKPSVGKLHVQNLKVVEALFYRTNTDNSISSKDFVFYLNSINLLVENDYKLIEVSENLSPLYWAALKTFVSMYIEPNLFLENASILLKEYTEKFSLESLPQKFQERINELLTIPRIMEEAKGDADQFFNLIEQKLNLASEIEQLNLVISYIYGIRAFTYSKNDLSWIKKRLEFIDSNLEVFSNNLDKLVYCEQVTILLSVYMILNNFLIHSLTQVLDENSYHDLDQISRYSYRTKFQLLSLSKKIENETASTNHQIIEHNVNVLGINLFIIYQSKQLTEKNNDEIIFNVTKVPN